MDAWRDVEVAAAEALDGPTAARARRDPRRHLHGRGGQGARARSPTTTSPRSSTCWRRPPGPAGRWIHFGLTSSDVLDTALALQLRARGRADRARARASSPPRSPSGRASTRTRSASAAPTASTPSRRRSGSSSPASRSRRTATPSGSSARSRRPRRGAISGAVGTYASLGPDYERRVLDAPRPGARAGLHPGRPARPPRRAAAGDRARRRRAGALRDRDPPPPAHRGARGRGAVPRRPEGLERDAAQAQPDHHRAHHRPRPRAARLRAGGARERRAVARARHLALGRRARVLPDATILLDYMQHLALRVVRGMTVHADRMRGQPRAHLRRAVLPARAARARRARACSATTPTGSSSGSPSRRGTRRRRCASCSSAEAGVELDLDAIFDYAPLHAPRPRGAGATGGDPDMT